MRDCVKNLALFMLLYAAVSITGAILMQKCSGGADTPVQGDTVRVTVTDTVRYTAPQAVSERRVGVFGVRVPRAAVIAAGGAGDVAPGAPHSVGDDLGQGASAPWSDSCSDPEDRVSEQRGDSVTIELPTVQRRYEGEDYTAWVSGVEPRLDSVRVYRVNERVTIRTPPRRWHIGPVAGMGLTPKGWQPYIGIGVTYSVISF